MPSTVRGSDNFDSKVATRRYHTITGRVHNQDYTNDLEYEIEVAVSVSGNGSFVALTVDGTTVSYFDMFDNGNYQVTVSGKVPPGSTYRIIKGNTDTIQFWREYK